MARRKNPSSNFDYVHEDILHGLEALERSAGRSNPRQDEILGLSGYKSRVLWPKFQDGGGVNSGSLSARDGRARVGGSLFTNEINFLTNKKRGKVKANPRQDEILGISGYHARVLWPKFSLTGGVNSGNADYIPTSTSGSLFNREINFLSNGRGGRRNRRNPFGEMIDQDTGSSYSQQQAEAESGGSSRRQYVQTPTMVATPAQGPRRNRRNPSKEQQVKALAQEITRTWAKVSPYAEPQLFFMLHPEHITGGDTIEMVVASFLGNAIGWRGEDARRIKAQLNKLL